MAGLNLSYAAAMNSRKSGVKSSSAPGTSAWWTLDSADIVVAFRVGVFPKASLLSPPIRVNAVHAENPRHSSGPLIQADAGDPLRSFHPSGCPCCHSNLHPCHSPLSPCHSKRSAAEPRNLKSLNTIPISHSRSFTPLAD